MVSGKRKSADRINATGEIEHGLAVADGGGRISRITEAQPCIFKHSVCCFVLLLLNRFHGTLQGRGRPRVTDSKRLLLYGETVL